MTGAVGARTWRSEVIEADAQTTDPSNTQVGDWWIRSDVQPSVDGATTVAALRIQGSGGVLEVPLFDSTEESNLGSDVYVGERFVFGDGTVAFIAQTDQSGSLGSPRLVTANGTKYQAHGALELNAIPDSGVSRWEFEQDVTDSWGSNDGTNNGATFTTDAKVGSYALDFDGTNDTVNVPDDPSLNFADGEEFSLSMWVKPASTSEIYTLFDKRADAGYRFKLNAGEVEFIITDGSSFNSNSTSSTPVSSANVWYHLVGTWDGDSISEIYVDGGSISTSTTSLGDLSDSADLNLGVRNSTPDQYLDGTLDDPRIYSKELTGTEVSNLYNTGSIDG